MTSGLAPPIATGASSFARLEEKIDKLAGEIQALKLELARLSHVHAVGERVEELRVTQARLLDRDEARSQRDSDVEQRIRELHAHTTRLVAWATLAGTLGGGGTVFGALRLFGG